MTEKYIPTKESEVRPNQIGWLGPVGTFTEIAAKMWLRKVGKKNVSLAQTHSPNIASMFKSVTESTLEMGVVPFENTTGGPVKDTHLALDELDGIRIIGEVVLPIKQYFYSQAGKEVKVIRSKDQALAQVRKWINEHYPQAEQQPVDSTSLAVQMAAEDPNVGAIAGASAADDLGLSEKLIRTEDSIEDNKANATTFVAIAKTIETPEPTGNDKTTFILELPNHAGSLYSTLADLAEKGINLTKIKSLRGIDGKVRFLVSVDGHQNDETVGPALAALNNKDTTLKILGSYAKENYIPKHKIEPNMTNAIAMIEKETKNGDVNTKDNAVIVFNLPNQIGALANILRIFAERKINLTKIDSMPSGNFEEYIFYLSFNKNDVKDQDNLDRELTGSTRNIVRLQ